MILSLANNLKSAWKGIISVFKMAALEQDGKKTEIFNYKKI